MSPEIVQISKFNGARCGLLALSGKTLHCPVPTGSDRFNRADRGRSGGPGSFAKLREAGEFDDHWRVEGETGGGLGRHFS